MDNSRIYDLQSLHRRFNDSSLPILTRQRSYKSYQSIQSRLKDRTLVKYRNRLVAAHRVNDAYEADKIEQTARSYVWRKYGDVPRYG